MNEVDPGICVGGAVGSKKKRTVALSAVGWLHLAAAPTFTIMALLTAVLDGDAHRITCMGVASASPLGSMSSCICSWAFSTPHLG